MSGRPRTHLRLRIANLVDLVLHSCWKVSICVAKKSGSVLMLPVITAMRSHRTDRSSVKTKLFEGIADIVQSAKSQTKSSDYKCQGRPVTPRLQLFLQVAFPRTLDVWRLRELTGICLVHDRGFVQLQIFAFGLAPNVIAETPCIPVWAQRKCGSERFRLRPVG